MNFRKLSQLGVAFAVLSLSTSAYAIPTPKNRTSINALALVEDATYNVSYDSFVLGALPLWISRSFDDGPKHILLRIQFEGSPSVYEMVDFVDGTELQITYNQYAGPGFVEVSIESITPF
ncbi:hypothetical protein ACFOWA_10910 [Pedobacter lithocola]|uniref:Uncharacterized protein n=1 Tax=Pedobacter lithocola TaxID=1908239 RepID=A0ABV8P8S5_9SPHI